MGKYAMFKKKRMNSNPKQGPLHYRSPSKILWRTIRGMVPHKTPRGAASLDRLKTYEGIPHPYDRKKRMVIPSCLKVLRIRPERKFCKLGDLSDEVGCKDKSKAFFVKKKAGLKAKADAVKSAKVSKED